MAQTHLSGTGTLAASGVRIAVAAANLTAHEHLVAKGLVTVYGSAHVRRSTDLL